MQRLPTNDWIKEQLLIGLVSKELNIPQPEAAERIKSLQAGTPPQRHCCSTGLVIC